MTGEQRWAASGVVVVLAALWGMAGAWALSEPYRWEPPGDDMTGSYVFLIGVLILAVDAAWLLARAGRRSGGWRPGSGRGVRWPHSPGSAPSSAC